jgi:5-carboxymethyl-2-hydroxymuconate isomerase
MPHFSIEYSANVGTAVDIGALCEVVRKAAVETGIFPLGGIRVRAIRCEHYGIADGLPDAGFVDILLRIGEGRALDVRQKAGAHIFDAVSAFFDPAFLAGSKFALSLDIQINDPATSWKRNNIHDLLKTEADNG